MAHRRLSLPPGRAARPLADRSSSAGEAAAVVAHKNIAGPLEQHPWVAGLSRYIELADADIDAIRNILEGQRQVRKRTDIVVQGYKYGSFLGFVEAGMAARYKLLHNGKRQILGVILPGDLIGFPASFYDRANFSVVAITDMSIQVCSFEAFLQACCQRPLLTMALLWLAVEETATYADHIIDTGSAPQSSVWRIFSSNYIRGLRRWAMPPARLLNCLYRRRRSEMYSGSAPHTSIVYSAVFARIG